MSSSSPAATSAHRGRLADRVIIVTGAAGGIGKVFAHRLAAEGAKVVLCDLTDSQPVVDEIASAGGQALGRITDVTSREAVEALVAAAAERFGTVHGLVNNAARTGMGSHPFTEISSDEWDRVMAVNTRGPFECARAVVPHFRRQGYGKIVNIVSGTLFKGNAGMMPYISSKGALVAMTRVMARELGADNVCVNAVAPGATQTERFGEEQTALRAGTVRSRCLQRHETPEDLVGAIVFLCSGESDFITGQTLVVDGGAVFN